MKTVMRAMVPALALAAGLALMPVTAEARHHGDACEGGEDAEATAPGTGPAARRHAVHMAIAAWKREVAAEHGWSYTSWSRATDKEIDCDTRKGNTECEVEADPCR